MKKALLFLILIFKNLAGCPYQILNDLDTPIIIVNPNSWGKIYYIEPKQKVEVNSAISNRLISWVKYESLDFYLPKEKGEYQKQYSLIEKYCSNEITTLALSEIKQMSKYPTDRFEVKVSLNTLE